MSKIALTTLMLKGYRFKRPLHTPLAGSRNRAGFNAGSFAVLTGERIANSGE